LIAADTDCLRCDQQLKLNILTNGYNDLHHSMHGQSIAVMTTPEDLNQQPLHCCQQIYPTASGNVASVAVMMPDTSLAGSCARSMQQWVDPAFMADVVHQGEICLA
jgi:hypothetical protein